MKIFLFDNLSREIRRYFIGTCPVKSKNISLGTVPRILRLLPAFGVDYFTHLLPTFVFQFLIYHPPLVWLILLFVCLLPTAPTFHCAHFPLCLLPFRLLPTAHCLLVPVPPVPVNLFLSFHQSQLLSPDKLSVTTE